MSAPCRHPNPQRYRAYRCVECLREVKRGYHRKNQRYDDWFERQAGLCAFCHLPMAYEDNATHLDHNHITGAKRGLVHAKCNAMIGGFERAVELLGLDAVLAYLR